MKLSTNHPNQTRLLALTLAVSVLVLQGCSFTSGHTENRDVGKYMKLKIGESNRVDIYKEFLQPIDVYSTPEGRSWMYSSIDANTHFTTFIPIVGLVTGGAIETAYTTYFHFDHGGILIDVKSSTEEEYVNTWERTAELTAESLNGRWSDAQSSVKDEMDALDLPYKEREKMKIAPRMYLDGSPANQSNESHANSTVSSSITQDVTPKPSDPKYASRAEEIAEAMMCSESLSLKTKSEESELWILQCGDGETLEVRCFEEQCYLK